MLIAVAAMFLQQTCGSIARALPGACAVDHCRTACRCRLGGVYFSLTAVAGLIGQLGSGGFIIRHGAIRMSQITLLFTGAGLALGRFRSSAERSAGRYRRIGGIAAQSGEGPLIEAKAVVLRARQGLLLLPHSRPR
jgi:hypothetical protein